MINQELNSFSYFQEFKLYGVVKVEQVGHSFPGSSQLDYFTIGFI
jgi:hypothetical protein